MVNACKFCISLRWEMDYGKCSVIDYDSSLGVSYYINKYVAKGFCDYDLWIKKGNRMITSCANSGDRRLVNRRRNE
jgi:hypothetical protein